MSIEQIALYLFVAAIVSMACRRIKLPYTVGLTVAGIVLASLPAVEIPNLTKELIFGLLLPPLIFEAAIQIAWGDLKRDFLPIVLLATVGMLIAAAIVGAGVHAFMGWEWTTSLLLAVLISATDPVSVIATMKDTKIGGRLRLLVESESLFNDGTAAVLFAVALAAATGGQVSIGSGLLAFVRCAGGGIVCGLSVGFAALFLAGRTDEKLIEATFTSVAAYASFLLAEHWQFSGVVATLCAGLLIGNSKSFCQFSDPGRETLVAFWEFVAFLANSLVFLLIGLRLAHHPLQHIWLSASIVLGLSLLGRAAAVYLTSACVSRSRYRIDWSHQHILFWGGLRGALALALALGLPATFEAKSAILDITFGVVAFSVLVQGLTVPPLLSRLGLTPKEP